MLVNLPEAAAALSHELSCLTALADSIPWIDHSKHSYPWEAITISSLGQVDQNDEIWGLGREVVKAGLEAVYSDISHHVAMFNQDQMTTPQSPPLILVIMPSPLSPRAKRADTPMQRRANSTAASCHSSNETCSESTTCYGRGNCALKSNSGGNECWGCKCANGYAGVECQKEDYTVWVHRYIS